MAYAILKAHLFNKNTPLDVMLSVTNRCNLHCRYCDIPLRNQREMTTEEIFALLDQLAKAGTQRLSLWGGEPLLREDIRHIINYAKKKKFYVNIDSNGYLVPEKINEIKKLDFIILSLDGEEKVHDANRQPGSYKKVMEAIKIATKVMPVFTLTVLTKYNIHSAWFILDKARELGFLPMFQIPYHPSGLSSDHNLYASDKEYKDAFRFLLKEKRKGNLTASSSEYLRYLTNWDDYHQPARAYKTKFDPTCWAGRLFCNIDTDGSLYPCPLFITKIKAPNILVDGFMPAFNKLVELDLDCEACLGHCCLEANLVFSLHIKTIWEWIRITSPGIKPKLIN